MHDIHRDSLLTGKGKSPQHHAAASEHHGHHQHDEHPDHDGHNHDHSVHHHEHHPEHHHAAADDHHHHDAHSPYQFWHDTQHHEEHYHGHDHRMSRERVYSHQHPHRHVYYHVHQHNHDTRLQTLFTEGRRDWFALTFMAFLIGVALFAPLPQGLGSGLLVAAFCIGVFPAAKNALFAAIHGRRLSVELFVVLLLLSLLVGGHFVVAAFSALFLLLGSFVHLDFSWRR